MGTKLLITSAFVLFINIPIILSQEPSDTLSLDSVFINKVSINGLSLMDTKQKIIEIFGVPDYYTKEFSEFDGSIFYVCKYDNKISFILNENEELSELDYFMLHGYRMYIEDFSFEIGDDSKVLKSKYPMSYNYWMKHGGNVLYLIGLDSNKNRIGYNLHIVIRDHKIFSFSVNIED